MRKMMRLAVLAGLVLAVVPGSASATENLIRFFERNAEKLVTQGEWAVVLVRAIGKDEEMDSDAGEIEYIALLERNRIQPLEGWNHGEFLTYGVKAVTMVQSLGLEEQLPPDATELQYIWLLESLGFHEGVPTEPVAYTDALQRNVNDPIFQEFAGNEFNISISRFAPEVDDR